MTLSFQTCVCGKTQITTGSLNRWNCTLCLSLELIRSRLTTSCRNELTSTAISFVIAQRLTMRITRMSAVGLGMYFCLLEIEIESLGNARHPQASPLAGVLFINPTIQLPHPLTQVVLT